MVQAAIFAVAATSIVLQCVFAPFAHGLYALISWVFSACCFALLAITHPVVAIGRRRMAAYGPNRQIGTEQLLEDPVVANAFMMTLPPPYKLTLVALVIFASADICDGLRLSAGRPEMGAFWEAMQELLTAVAAAVLFWATRGLAAAPSRTLYYACFCAGSLAAFQLQSLMPPTPPALGGGGADGSTDGGWMEAAYTGCLACRTFAASALAAQAASALCGAIFPADGSWSLSALQGDFPRWAAQAAGALLLLAPPALRALLKMPHGGGALALGASRLAVGCLTLSAWCALYPVEIDRDEDISAAAAAQSGYPSIDAMKAARRAARERRTVPPAPPPLMLESLHRRGGVQGLGWHDSALCRDKDGDEAHDFWEAVGGGCFRPIAGAVSAAKAA